MKIKTLSLLASIPVAATGVLGFSNAADALPFPGFSDGDALQLTGSVQLNNRDFTGPAILFCPDSVTFIGCAIPGDTAITNVPGSGNTGGFAGFDTPNPNPPGVGVSFQGTVKSFDTSTPIGGIISSFVTLPSIVTGGTEPGPDFPSAVLSLDVTTLNFPMLDLNPQTPGATSEASFNAFGTITYFDPIDSIEKSHRIFYDFTANGLFLPPGTSPQEVVTAIGSYSGTVFIVKDAEVVPEPSLVIGFITLGGMVLAGKNKVKKSSASL